MADEREILKYELDIADVEAKSQRLRQIGEQNRGTELSRVIDRREADPRFEAVQKEENAYRSLNRAQSENATGVMNLIAHKKQLAAAVALAGGEFGGLIGQLSSVTMLMMSATGGVAAFAGGLAAIAIAGTVFQKIRQDADAATKAQDALNEKFAELHKLQRGPELQIADELEKRGALSEANVSAAWAVRRQAMIQYRQSSPEVAAAATAAGVTSIEDVAVLGQIMGRGIELKDTAAVHKALEEAKRSGAYPDLLREAQRRRGVNALSGIQAEGEHVAEGPSRQSAEEAAFYRMKTGGVLPAGVETYRQFWDLLMKGRSDQARLKEIDTEIDRLEGLDVAGVSVGTRLWSTRGERERVQRSVDLGLSMELRVDQERRAQGGQVPPVTTMPAPEAGLGDSQAVRDLIDALRENTAAQRGTPLQPTANTMNTTYIGTAWMMPDERNSSFDIPFGTGRIDERGQP